MALRIRCVQIYDQGWVADGNWQFGGCPQHVFHSSLPPGLQKKRARSRAATHLPTGSQGPRGSRGFHFGPLANGAQNCAGLFEESCLFFKLKLN